MERLGVATLIGERRVGRIAGSQDGSFIVERSFGRGSFPLPRERAEVVPGERLAHGQLHPATDGDYREHRRFSTRALR